MGLDADSIDSILINLRPDYCLTHVRQYCYICVCHHFNHPSLIHLSFLT